MFLELACIRWFPAHVLFLSFFTNTVLLACFLGMSVGCLAAERRRSYLVWTPLLLAAALGAAHLVESARLRTGSIVDVGNQRSAQLIFFGVDYQAGDPSAFVIPIEVLCAFFFLMIALAFMGPGQQLGRALRSLPNRLEAYTFNILGSLAGILLFAACSRLELSPLWWFAIVLAALAYFLMPEDRVRGLMLAVGPALILILSTSAGGSFSPSGRAAGEQDRSPYYRVDFDPASRIIRVNLIGHQQMVGRQEPYPAYALPHLLNRDAGGRPFAQALVIGAGSGNDVSRALEWGAERVDAVEIDPVIYRLGREHHPDHPYDGRRVFVHLDDGRNFLRSTNRKYDLIVYALVDSLVLHSSYSNIRLESYLFTKQAFEDVREHLRPDGVFVMYNFFRQGWLVGRLQNALNETFGTNNSLILNLPPRDVVNPDQVLFGEFTMLFAGATGPLREAFSRHSEYWLKTEVSPDGRLANGFELPVPTERAALKAAVDQSGQMAGWIPFVPTRVVQPAGPLRIATDDWPFLYLREPMIPGLSLRGMAIMGSIALLLILPFVVTRRREAQSERGTQSTLTKGMSAQMFFLGAGFMLIETKAVVQMALLFGGTWVVNSVVFFAILLMILLTNVLVLVTRPRRIAPYYVGVFVTLAMNAVVPMDFFLGRDPTTQIVGSCLLAFTPIFFAGFVFALAFSQAPEPDRAFGFNIAGAIFGGLAEYSSMVLGFQYLLLVALAFYALSALGVWPATRLKPGPTAEEFSPVGL